MLRDERHPLLSALLAFLAGGMVLAGCAGREVNPDLERARTAYEEARQDPAIVSKASVALYEAGKAFEEAENAWRGSGDQAVVSHLAYLAQRKTETAAATAQRRLAEAEMEKLVQERDQSILAGRTREAELGRRKALEAKEMAEARALEAELARRDKMAAEARLRELERQLSEMDARKTGRGLVLTIEGVLFEFNKADLKPGATRNLDKLADFLRENPERTVLIEGHTDDVGSGTYNLLLSQKRADAVRDYLVARGVAPGRIQSRGLGEEYPVISNANEAGRQRNRRVEIVVSQ